MNAALAGFAMLIIGDSHIGAAWFFNDALQNALVAQGAQLNSFGVCGSGAVDWVTPAPISCGRAERHNGDPAKIENERGLRGWSLAALINQYKPNLVVIELGDTLAGYGQTPTLPRDLIAEQVQTLLTPIKARNLSCIWIGPPWGTEGGAYRKTFQRVKEVSDYLSQIVAPCHYVDSLRFSQPGQWDTRDGLHLTEQSNEAWDKYLVSSIDQIAQGLPRH
ncbi:MAG TPA: SGNH/GDSL hydrolase family protein [Stellaceae bacterium]|jgi:hypothetical protein